MRSLINFRSSSLPPISDIYSRLLCSILQYHTFRPFRTRFCAPTHAPTQVRLNYSCVLILADIFLESLPFRFHDILLSKYILKRARTSSNFLFSVIITNEEKGKHICGATRWRKMHVSLYIGGMKRVIGNN